MGALRGGEGKGTGSPGTPGPHGWGPGRPGALLARDMGALGALRGREGKDHEPPSTWEPFGGPGPFSLTPSPRYLWGTPELLGSRISSYMLYKLHVYVYFPFLNGPYMSLFHFFS